MTAFNYATCVFVLCISAKNSPVLEDSIGIRSRNFPISKKGCSSMYRTSIHRVVNNLLAGLCIEYFGRMGGQMFFCRNFSRNPSMGKWIFWKFVRSFAPLTSPCLPFYKRAGITDRKNYVKAFRNRF